MWNLVSKFLKTNIAFYALGILLLSSFIYIAYNFAFTIGYDSCNKEFVAYKHEQLQKVLELETKFHEQEEKYQAETQALVQQVSESKEDFNNRLNAIERSYADRLQQSEQRASLYSKMSSNPSNSKSNLAAHTAKLDKALVEGRQLVAELRATIELRDEQLRQCGEQFKLMENAYAGSGRE